MNVYPSGTLIANRYEVVQGPREKLSLAGGMGLVYLCVDHAENGRPVALKTFRPELLPDRAARDRFLREGTTWVQLGKHPHIVRCHRVVSPGSRLEVYLVLELIDADKGKRDASLRSWLRPSKPLSVEQAFVFALHIVHGMKHAAAKIPGFVHRDLKPENILVERDGHAKVTDFGLAGIPSDLPGIQFEQINDVSQPLARCRLLTLPDGFVGTPEYASPEQFEARSLDQRSDIYAFGCIFYEILTGQHPFQQIYATVKERLLKYKGCHLSENPRPPKTIVPTILDEAEALVLRCLYKNPDERYQSWIELETSIRNIYHAIIGKETPNEMTTAEKTRAERIEEGYSYNAIGTSYRAIAKFDVALKYLQKVVQIGQAEKDRELESSGLGNLGTIYKELGKPEHAITFHEQALAMMREDGNRLGEGGELINLGEAYRYLGDLEHAHKFYTQAHAIDRELGNALAECMTLMSLGIVSRESNDPGFAIGLYQQALTLAREIDDISMQSLILNNLGNAYLDRGDLLQAAQCYEQNLKISRMIGDRRGEGLANLNLGNAYRMVGDPDKALIHFERALIIHRDAGERNWEAGVLDSLSSLYADLGDLHQAITCDQQRLVIAREIGDKRMEGITLNNLGYTLSLFGDQDKAFDFYMLGLKIVREISDHRTERLIITNLWKLSISFFQQGTFDRAITCLERSLSFTRDIGDRKFEGKILSDLAACYDTLGNQYQAIELYESSLAIACEVGDVVGIATVNFNLIPLLAEHGRLLDALSHAEYAEKIFDLNGQKQYVKVMQTMINQLRTKMP